MEYQETPFVRFTLHTWIKYQKFKGASAICAIFLNFLLLIFKMVFCGIALLVLAPHMAALHLISRRQESTSRNIVRIILYVLCVVISLVLDIPIILVALVGVVGCVGLIPEVLTNPPTIVAVIVFGAVAVIFGKLAFTLISGLFVKRLPEIVEEDTVEDVEEEVTEYTDEDGDIEELPFCQLFRIGTEMCLLIDHVEMCPDETAFIRVVDDEGYTPLYKRKVRRDKRGNRFIQFNGENLYLKDEKTQPIITKK